MDFGIAGKVALISGGTQGIGLAAAQALLNEGVHVAIFSRNQDHVDSAIKTLRAGSSKVIGMQCDFLEEKSVNETLQAIHSDLGPIDIFVGSSGGPSIGHAHEITHDQLMGALDANFAALAALTNKLLPNMQKNNWGRVVYVATSGVIQPIVNLALSNTARSALVSFAKTLSAEIAESGVTVNSVIPGKIETQHLKELTQSKAAARSMSYEEQMTKDIADIPAQRYGSPEEIANVIAFLCSDSASYVTGVKIPVDGGMIKSV